MQHKFIDDEIVYTGKQLSPHWIYKNFGIKGDAIVSFCGEAKVNLTEMVDIEDVLANEPIYSKKMLNFIVEHFDIRLFEAVLRQRMFMSIIKESLEDLGHKVLRKGDDLYVNDKKLSVSIATKSITSCLMHIGLNINAEGAPIKAADLKHDLSVNSVKDLSLCIMKRYCDEMSDILDATSKVRGLA